MPTAKEDQLTCVIEAIRALNFDPLVVLETDSALDEIRDALIDVYARLAGRELPEIPEPTEQQRAEWLEFRCFEQQTLGLR